MKKSKILAGALALMLVVTGCGGKTTGNTEEVVKNATEKMNGLDNYHVSMTIDMSFTAGGISSSFAVDTEQDYDIKNSTAYVVTSTSMLDTDIQTESYTQVKDGEASVYTSEDGETWIKQVIEAQELTSNVDFDLISKAKEVKVEKEENGVTTYAAVLDEEATKELLKDMDVDPEEEGVEVQETTMKFAVDKDGYITRYEITVSVTGEGQTSTIKVTSKFSKFNTVGNIEIPEEVIESAREF